MPKITALPTLTTPAIPDVFAIVDDSAGETKKITLQTLKNFFSPTGVIADYAGATPPDGWLLCYGQAVSRTTYAELFTAIGTNYGTGDGSTTFNIPDERGVVTAGKDDMGGTPANRLTGLAGGVDGSVLGAIGGLQQHTLTAAQMPVHTHTQNQHRHLMTSVAIGATRNYSNFGSDAGIVGNRFTDYETASNQNAGSGGAHNNVQPTGIKNRIIRY